MLARHRTPPNLYLKPVMNQDDAGQPRSRRSFLIDSLTAPIALGTGTSWIARRAVADPPRASKVIDCHAHLYHRSRSSWEADDRKLIEAADRLGIDQLCCSILTPRRPATAEGFRECNQWVADAMRRFPGRVLGYCYVNPATGKEATEEIRRCVGGLGFIGVKLYDEHKCTEPVVFAVIETAIELGVPVLHHAGHLHYPLQEQPRISDGGDLAELARRYPEATLICAHICGGGDWEWTIKALRHAPSVYLDTSGSVTDDGVVNMAARTLGVDRILFGCDMSLTAGVGRIRAAELSVKDKERILGGNMQAILKRRKP
jgi:predicted TIM-barrel fold metal-dependent hydrolase